ncbi:MAG: hypothetical protein IID44_02705 [Planctomycetes bacterium]|nr:hypothetical protein [Planctomycetota bacterium]
MVSQHSQSAAAPMTYRLIVTEPAERDLDACYDYIFKRSPEGSLRWLDAFGAVAAVIESKGKRVS